MLIKCHTVDGKDVLVEESKLLTRRTVYALVTNDKNQILVEDAGQKNGKYWFLGGGLEEGEDIYSALAREVREEANIEVKPVRQFDSRQYCYIHSTSKIPYRCNAEYILCKYVSVLNNDSEGAVKTKWLDIGKLEESEFDELIREVVRKLKYL